MHFRLISYPGSGSVEFERFVSERLGCGLERIGRLPNPGAQSRPAALAAAGPKTAGPLVCLVRDGRDVLKALAERDDGESADRLRMLICHPTVFSLPSWSRHVDEWTAQADLVVRYEDLATVPDQVACRLASAVCDEAGKTSIGADGSSDPSSRPDQAHPGAVLPEELELLFWACHGPAMERLGYGCRPGSIGFNDTLDGGVLARAGYPTPPAGQTRRVLVEAEKLLQPGTDGVKRYLVQLLKGLDDMSTHGNGAWSFDILRGGEIVPLESCRDMLQQFLELGNPGRELGLLRPHLHGWESWLLELKDLARHHMPGGAYEAAARYYRRGPFRDWLDRTRRTWSKWHDPAAREEWLTRLAQYDLVHVPLPQNSAMFTHYPGRLLITVHDLTHRTHANYHRQENVRNAEAGMKLAMDRGAHLLAISDNTARDIRQHYRVSPARIHMASQAPDRDTLGPVIDPDALEAVRMKYRIGFERFLLCLSTIEPRKNLLNTVRAFHRFREHHPGYPCRLVIAGSHGWKTDGLFQGVDLDRPDLHFTGFIDESDLPALYSAADVLCYVSHYEGFGLPLLEAMACGTPVIFGDNSSMPEVAGDGGLGADSTDVDDIAACMERLCLDHQLLQDLSRRALERSMRFTRRRMVMETLRAYEGSC